RIRRARALRENTTPQLIQELADAARQLYNLRFTFATQQVGDVKEIRNLRKEIARMRGILRERELAGEDLSASVAQPAEEEPEAAEEAQEAELAQTEDQGAS
ncbi:MAG: 50S ribosomal protein L29, partial [Armatimonadota bacterium]